MSRPSDPARPAPGANPGAEEPRAWRPDFGRRSTPAKPWLLLGPAAVALAVVVLLFGMARRLTRQEDVLVVYTSQDQVYAEPVLQLFERETGVKVQAVFDSEAVKTVGLANRLLAERSSPRCDVFWNNEALRTRQLQAEGVLDTGTNAVDFGYRSRRLVINTNILDPARAPRSLRDLTNAAWSGKVALAYPLFGTTATHFHALRQAWGEPAWLNWCRALQANRPLVVDGNSMVVRVVASGQAPVGLTDWDDVAAGQREGQPLALLPLDPESLLIPNTASLAHGAPHPNAARQFLDFLVRADIRQHLATAGALENPDLGDAGAAGLRPDWPSLLLDLEPATAALKEVFLR